MGALDGFVVGCDVFDDDLIVGSRDTGTLVGDPVVNCLAGDMVGIFKVGLKDSGAEVE